MSIDTIAKELRDACERAAKGERVVSIYLFGIRNADRLRGQNLREIANRAGISEAYGTELAKAVRLAEHVTLR